MMSINHLSPAGYAPLCDDAQRTLRALALARGDNALALTLGVHRQTLARAAAGQPVARTVRYMLEDWARQQEATR
jgi:hypothetical protein